MDQLTLYPILILIVFVIINITTVILFYIDKQRAIKHQSRISEKTLLLVSFLGGGIGAWIGMTRFRHKTQNFKFKVGVPIGALLSLFILIFFLFI